MVKVKLLAAVLFVGVQAGGLSAIAKSMNLNIADICYSESKASLQIEYYSPFILDENSISSEIKKIGNAYVLEVVTSQLAGLAMPVSGSLEVPVGELDDFFYPESKLEYLRMEFGKFDLETSHLTNEIPTCPEKLGLFQPL